MSTSKQFGPYTLMRKLGSGGMAVTFEAERRGPGGFVQRVCLKRILSAFESDAEFVRLFLEEARIAAGLRHNNIVQVLDFGLADKSHFLALELVDGLDLRALLRALRDRGEALEPELVTLIGIEIATALDAAHQADERGHAQGVIHRDVSPANVLLSTAGEVKLTDFGIAKAMSSPRITRSGVVKGKVPYMAPEYALNGQASVRSDLFSLGVTLYEALAGARPFQGENDLEVLNAARSGRFRPLASLRPDAPAELTRAIEALLALAPDARPLHAAALIEALAAVAGPPTGRKLLGKLVADAAASLPPAGSLDDELQAQPVGPQTLQMTAALGDDGVVEPVRASDAGDETRTRIPSQSPPSASSSPRDRSTWRGATPDPISEAPAALAPGARSVSTGRTLLKAQSFPAPPRAEARGRETAREMMASADDTQLPSAHESQAPRPSRTTRRGFGTAPGMSSVDAPSLPMKRRRAFMGAAVLLLALGLVGAFFFGHEQPPSDAVPAGNEEAGAPGVNGASGAERTSPSPSPTAIAAEAQGTPNETPAVERGVDLRVVAVPYGQVWIDGELRGKSPLTLTGLAAGTHEIAVGKQSPTLKKSIELPEAPGPTLQHVLGPLD